MHRQEEQDREVDQDASLRRLYYHWRNYLEQHYMLLNNSRNFFTNYAHISDRGSISSLSPSLLSLLPPLSLPPPPSQQLPSNIDYYKLTLFTEKVKLQPPGSYFSYDVTDKKAFEKSFSGFRNHQPEIRSCSPGPPPPWKMDSIHAYAKEGDVENLLKCIENGISVNIKDSKGRTPLHWAVDRGHLTVTELLISSKADANIKDNEGETPLHLAVVCDREAIAEYLVKHGADANIKDNDGCSPRDLCLKNWPCMRQ